MLDRELEQRTTAEWLALFAGAVPAAPINDLAQALDNPFVTEHGRLQTHPAPGAGVLPHGRPAGADARARKRQRARHRRSASTRKRCCGKSATTQRALQR